MVLSKDLECTKAYVRCDSGYDGYHETHLIVAVYSEHVPSRLGRQNKDKAARVRDYYLRCKVPCFIGREHCDVLSMQIDSDLVIYQTTLLRTFQVPPPPSSQIAAAGRRPTPPPPPPSSPEIRSSQFDEENPSAQISSGLLVQADEGVSYSVVDLIVVIYRSLP
ncbi:hypothetical protein F511_44957 [Dorcoceras hygrometricum]|uniref:Uncharacterized protein n=1 Tax=Dorcoceras hygrometricum TaxID=472368 RepID=A0A2Z7BTZ6_9LAMI|nr:hypothetical protein F511_44957 [Dorcoceras hygrometricum]